MFSTANKINNNMISRVVGTILALFVLTIIVMAVIESGNRMTEPPAGMEIPEGADSTVTIISPDSLPAVVDGTTLP